MIGINVDIAKKIKKNIVRVQRQPVLDALDVKYMRALETSDPAISTIVAQKQALRDITDRVEAVTTFDELNALEFPELE